MTRVTIVIPVKDEEAGLEYLLSDFEGSLPIKKYDVNFIFVIDERTNDNSRHYASKLSLNIIDQKGSHGKGDAIKKAKQTLEGIDSDIVVFLDADGSYSFDGVCSLISPLERGEADVTSGSRFLGQRGKPEGMSGLHYFGNLFLSATSSLRNRRKISDLCTGLWAFTYSSITSMKISSSGFDLEAEIAGKVRKNKLRHKEIPVVWSQRKGGKSKLRSLTDGGIIFLRILRT